MFLGINTYTADQSLIRISYRKYYLYTYCFRKEWLNDW